MKMADWRTGILDEFAAGVRKLTLVADPDGLLSEARLAAALRAKGFDVIAFGDSVEFRYVYESRYRGEWDAGRETDLVVALRAEADDLGFLPYDLLQAGRKLKFGLPGIFPNLSYSVLSRVGRDLLDGIWEAQLKTPVSAMPGNSEAKTIDFILRHVYGIDMAAIASDEALLAKLLGLHYTGREPKGDVAARFAAGVKAKGVAAAWPLERIAGNRAEFLAWLQEAWERYLEEVECGDSDDAPDARVVAGAPSPDPLPSARTLCAKEVRVWLDDYFVDGLLKPVQSAAKFPKNAWQRCGIAGGAAGGADARTERLFGKLEGSVPPPEASWKVWTGYAQTFGELSAQVFGRGAPDGGAEARFAELRRKADGALAEWLARKYGPLAATVAEDPVMVHQIPGHIADACAMAGGGGRVALVVVDGLAMGQWTVLKEEMVRRAPSLLVDDCGVMAWVPTLTAVSRQAIFSGKMPYLFASSIATTAREKAQWQNFWAERGYGKSQAPYVKAKGTDGDLGAIRAAIAGQTGKCALGIVLNMVDDMMHGIQFGGMGAFTVQVRSWAATNFPNDLVEMLLEAGFAVYLTADHGNVECTGAGKPEDGIADVKGLRARVYGSEAQRAAALASCPRAAKWPAAEMGLPRDYLPILAGEGEAFCKAGDRWISHGGISLEELVVPFARIARRGRA